MVLSADSTNLEFCDKAADDESASPELRLSFARKANGSAFPPDFKQDAPKLTGIRANSGQSQRHCSFRRRDCLLGVSDSGALPIHHGVVTGTSGDKC